MIRIKFVFLFLLLAGASYAQQTPFWNDIQAFRKKDSINMPAAGQVLFIGSSSFTMWTDMQNYFPAIPVINRGFGGSSISDLLLYKEDLLFRYNPKQIVIYCGENDFAASDTVSVETVVMRFKELFEAIRSRNTKIHVAYVSMKPSPSRQHLMPKFMLTNAKIKLFLQKHKNTAFIDVYHKMLKEDGSPMADIFLADNLHMNAMGYAIWQKEIARYLVKQ